MTTSNNPPAFPEVPADSNAYEGRPGMTLRDWFAGQALAGMSAISDEDGDMIMGWADMAQAAFIAADAMLAERAKATGEAA